MVVKKYMQLVSKDKKHLIKACPYVFVFIVAFLLSCYINTEMDDLILKDAINKYGNVFEWARFYGNNWGGRILSQGILVLLLQLPDIFFQIINAFMWMLLIVYIVKIFDYKQLLKKDVALILFFFMMLILLPSSVLRWTVFWKSASVSYIWGTSTALVTMWPYVKLSFNDVPTVKDWVLAFVCCIYASNYEQIAVLLCAGMLLLLLYSAFSNKNKLPFKSLVLGSVLLLFSIGFTAFFLAMPGNTARLTSEIIQWYPNFKMYSVFDKASTGINYALGESEKRIAFLYLALAFIVLVVNLKRNSRLMKVLSAICFVFYLFNFIHRIGDSLNGTFYMLSRLFALADFEAADFVITGKRAMAECVNIVMICFLGSSLCVLEENKFDMTIFIAFFGGLATMAMMGFSPTIYASGHRSMFICFLLMLCSLFKSSLVIARRYM
ncbi:hypothetical protein SAMN02910371_02104 [Butyrivibrio sp. INlla14]|nr:hypothetical protein SAMN02910371_02104 [Butyrivibrio sp. INlla14]